MHFNRAQLLSHGFVEGRAAALDMMEHALASVDPARALLEELRLEGHCLSIAGDEFDLDRFEHVFVVGAGKATYPQAFALEQLLEGRITDGFIAVKTEQLARFTEDLGPLRHIRAAEAGHPVPNALSLAAGREVLAIADRAGPRDLVVCLMSGGVSAQCILPWRGISVVDKATVNRLLVTSGAEVTEIMTVRRHLSQIKGGRLALRMHPATVLALTVSDEKTDTMEWNTDWTSPDSSTTADAVRVLRKYGLWAEAPAAVRALLEDADRAVETPKTLAHVDVYNHMIVKTRSLGVAAARRARELGLKPLFLTSLLGGESREVGRTLTCIAREVALSGDPLSAPCVLIATGETSVRIVGDPSGSGGANQELAAGACLDLRPGDPIAVCALDTDGTDGSNAVAGALTDGTTAPRAAAAGVDLFAALMQHDVARGLGAAEDLIVTGPTGTNVNDLVLLVVLPAGR